MIKIGIAQWCLDCYGVEAVYKAYELGFSAIQIDAGGSNGAPFLNNSVVQKAYTKAIQSTGIEISAIGINILNDYDIKSVEGSEEDKKRWNIIKSTINSASKMNIDLIFFPSFNKNEIQCEQDFITTSKILRKACEYANTFGINIATENTLGIAENLKLLKIVNNPDFHILIDTLNPVLWGHNTAELIKSLWPYMCNQVHAKDGKEDVMGNACLGTGKANFLETMTVLKYMGFSGTIILENEYNKETDIHMDRDISIIKKVFYEKE